MRTVPTMGVSVSGRSSASRKTRATGIGPRASAKQQEVYDPKGKSQVGSQLPPVFDIIARKSPVAPDVKEGTKSAAPDRQAVSFSFAPFRAEISANSGGILASWGGFRMGNRRPEGAAPPVTVAFVGYRDSRRRGDGLQPMGIGAGFPLPQ